MVLIRGLNLAFLCKLTLVRRIFFVEILFILNTTVLSRLIIFLARPPSFSKAPALGGSGILSLLYLIFSVSEFLFPHILLPLSAFRLVPIGWLVWRLGLEIVLLRRPIVLVWRFGLLSELGLLSDGWVVVGDVFFGLDLLNDGWAGGEFGVKSGTRLIDILFGAKQPFMDRISVILHMPGISLTLTSQLSEIKPCCNYENNSKNDSITVLQKVNRQLLDYRVRNQIHLVNDYPCE